MMRSSSPIRNHEGTSCQSGWSPDGSVSASWVAGRCVMAISPAFGAGTSWQNTSWKLHSGWSVADRLSQSSKRIAASVRPRREQGPLPQLGAEVARVRIGDHLARVVARAEALPDQVVEAELLGTRDLDHAIHWRTEGDLCQGAGDIVRRHGLDEHRRQADRGAVGGSIGNALDELEELRRVNDRVGDRRVLDQLLLCDLRAEVAAFAQALGAYDRQGHVMPHTGRRFRGQEVACRRLEELQNRLILKEGAFDTSTTTEALARAVGESLAGEGVDTRPG